MSFSFSPGESDGAGGGAVSYAGGKRSAEEAHRRRPQRAHEGPQRVQHYCGEWRDKAGEHKYWAGRGFYMSKIDMDYTRDLHVKSAFT